jgi:hypothetical protein
MINEICPLIDECKFFNRGYLSSGIVMKTYNKKYCCDNVHFRECKRYIVFLVTGKQAPEYIMPNSLLSIDEISWKSEY